MTKWNGPSWSSRSQRWVVTDTLALILGLLGESAASTATTDKAIDNLIAMLDSGISVPEFLSQIFFHTEFRSP